MKTQAREVYGSGPLLATRQDRAAHAARVILLALALAAVAAWAAW